MLKKVVTVVLSFAMMVLFVNGPISADSSDSSEKYILTSDESGEEIGRFKTLNLSTIAVAYQPYGAYTITLTEDDLDMGSWAMVMSGYKVTITSGAGGPYSIVNRRVSSEKGTERHFSQVGGELVLENIIMDGGGVGGGFLVYPDKQVKDAKTSLTLKDGAIIQNCKGYHVDSNAIRTMGSPSTVTIDGGIMRNNISARNGGAISLVGDDNTLIMNSGELSGNFASTGSGGAISVSTGTFIMNGGTIKDNKAVDMGGGIVIGGDAKHFEINGGNIIGNTSNTGAGLYMQRNERGSDWNINNLTVEDNHSASDGGGIFTDNNLFISNTHISNNISDTARGGIRTSKKIDINNTNLIGNSAPEGGAIIARSRDNEISKITNAVFESNSAKFGGAIENFDSHIEIRDSKFYGNNATAHSGAIYSYDNASVDVVGGTEFVGNEAAKEGGAIYDYLSKYTDPFEEEDYAHLYLADDTYFDDNFSKMGLYDSPESAFELSNLGFSKTSLHDLDIIDNPHVLNNYDLNYVMNGYDIEIIKVTYNSNGGEGSYIDDIAKNTDYSIKDSVSTRISKPNYSLVSWNTKADGTGDSFIPGSIQQFSSPVELFAQWEIDKYNIDFNTNGGSLIPRQTVNHNEVFERPENPTKLGYTFENWYLDEDLTTVYDFSTQATSDITVYAKWDINQYTVKYETFGGSQVSDETVDYLDTFTKPESPVKEGHEFAGWFTDENFNTEYDFTQDATRDIKLYARWISKIIDTPDVPNKEEPETPDKENPIYPENPGPKDPSESDKDSEPKVPESKLPSTGVNSSHNSFYFIVSGIFIVIISQKSKKKVIR